MDRLNIISIRDNLLKEKISIFSVSDFIRIFKVKSKTARAFLSFHTKKGSFKRIVKGTYILSSNPPSYFEIANHILRPSYVSLETALSIYSMIPETVYTITSITTIHSKEYDILGQNYIYRKIKKELYFGYLPVKISNDKIILIANKEKALLDYIYFKSLTKQPISERLDISKIDKKQLGKYISIFKNRFRKNKAFIDLVEKLMI